MASSATSAKSPESRKHYDQLHLDIQRQATDLERDINVSMEGLKPFPITREMLNTVDGIEKRVQKLNFDLQELEEGLRAGLTGASTNPKIPRLQEQVAMVNASFDRLNQFALACIDLKSTSTSGAEDARTASTTHLSRADALALHAAKLEADKHAHTVDVEATIRKLDPRIRAAIERAPEMATRPQDRIATTYFAATLTKDRAPVSEKDKAALAETRRSHTFG